MKVLEMTTIASSARSFCVPLARELVRRGHSVEFALQRDGTETELEREFVVHEIRMSRRPVSLRNVLGFKDIYELIRRIKPDVVHVHTPVAGVLGRLAALLWGVPFVWSYRGDPTQSMPRVIRTMFLRAEDVLNKRSSAIITLTNIQKEELLLRLGGQCPKTVVQGCGGCGVDMGRFDPNKLSISRTEIRTELGIPQHARVIGFVGRLVTHKGLVELCQAFDLIRKDDKQVYLLIVGGHAHEERNVLRHDDLMQYLAGSDERVAFTGRVSDVERYMMAMDILAVPSHEEGFGQVYAEAAALGIPSIGCFGTGAEEAIEDGKTGFLVPPRDPKRLAHILRDLLKNDVLRVNLGRRARERALSVFDSRRVVQLQADVIEQVAGRNLVSHN